jgi:hypothetical protein
MISTLKKSIKEKNCLIRKTISSLKKHYIYLAKTNKI